MRSLYSWAGIWLFILAAVATPIGLTSCEQEGPMEKAGESMDKAAEDVQDAMGDAGEDMEDAMDDMGEAMEDATGQ